MESTAVTSTQPALMTRRARREAEQRAQALRARGHEVSPVNHNPVPRPPAVQLPAGHPSAPVPAVPRPAFADVPVASPRPTTNPAPAVNPAPVTNPWAGRPGVEARRAALRVTEPGVTEPGAAPGVTESAFIRTRHAEPSSGEPGYVPLRSTRTRVAYAPQPVPAPHAPQQVSSQQISRPALPLVVASPVVVAPAVGRVATPDPAPAEPFETLVTGAVPRQSRPASSVPAGHRIISRATVIGTLACATIAAPFAQGLQPSGQSPFDVEAPRTGPNVLDLVTQPVERPETSSAVVRAEAMTRPESAASRSVERSPLPDCDVDAPVEGTNGALADHSLCELWQGGEFLRPDAALSLSALNEAFRASFGRDLCLVASYRDIDTQYELKVSRGYYAASPGTSMHGWGLAIDLCSKETGSSEVFSWLWANAPTYGWQNPAWAQLGGSKYEPWHWEFVSGVVEKGEWRG